MSPPPPATTSSSARARARCLTPRGRARLEARIAEARAAYRAVCASNEEAAGAGDSSVWHDNFAYEENQRQMHQLARRVRDLEELLLVAQVVPPCATAPAHVQLGATVRVRRVEDGHEASWYIAGDEDGDPSAGRISCASPLARCLIGAEPGDVRTVTEGGRRVELEVVDLGPAPPSELA